MTLSFQPDTILAHYRIISKIGAGGMGEVYLAQDIKLDRKVALKVLLTEVATDDVRVRRFVQEAKAASALNHPNILTVYEIGVFEDSNYIAAEFIKGRTLRDHNIFEPMTLLEILDVAVQVAAALNAAHEAGIVHRDIKPENIMIRDDGLVKVLDFGLAKLTEKSTDLPSPEEATVPMVNTEPGMVMGTFAYMSPEQARGKAIDGRTDIWSLGVVLYELLAGRRPFEGEEAMDLMSSILKESAPPLRQFSPKLPRQIERIVDKMLRKDVDNRYQHVKDLQIDLEDLRDELKFEERLGQSTGATVASTPTQTDSRNIHSTLHTAATIVTDRRFNIFHALLFSVAVIGIAGVIWWYRSAFMPTQVIPGSYKVQDVASWTAAPGELFSNASFSPDGKMIAFASTRSKSKNIWVKQTGSADALQITKSTFSDSDPIWSPNGDEVAFFSERGGSGDGNSVTGVWRVSALSGTPRSIGPINDGSCELRRWTESGKIYYQSMGELFAMDISNGASEKVTHFAQQNKKVSWADISADEEQIAYVTNHEGHWRLFISDIKDTDPVLAAEGEGEVGGIAWQPKKNRIYYSYAVNGVDQIFFRDIGKNESVQITASATDEFVVDAASDSGSVLFSSVKEESNIWSVGVEDQKESPVVRTINSELWPEVSHDGTSIVFQSIKNLSRGANLFSGSILVKPLNSAEDDPSQQLAEGGFLPSWSPDGKTVAYLKNNNKAAELFAVNIEGGGERRLAADVASVGYSISPYNIIQTDAFAWSPDGTLIAYVSDRSGAANVWMVSQRDGKDMAVTDNQDADVSYYCPIWSSDGKRIAFFSQSKKVNADGNTERGLLIVNVESKQAKQVFKSVKPVRLINWTADENGLVIAELDSPGRSIGPETMLRKIDIASGEESDIVGLKNAYFYNIFASADRKQYAFAARNEHLDDIYAVSASGGMPRKLTSNNDSGVNFSRLAWKNDGSAIVFGKQTRFSLLSMITDIK